MQFLALFVFSFASSLYTKKGTGFMTKLHEILAAEKSVNASWATLKTDTLTKFAKPEHFFSGHTKRLAMLEDNPANKAIEAAAKEDKALPTNVYDTLDYALGIFANAENLQYQKNATNAAARASVEFRGTTILADLPVDQLLGLEARLEALRTVILAAPTLDAGREWTFDTTQGCFVAEPESTTKTEKIMVPVVLAQATDKHPAQVKESTKDNVIGSFSLIRRSGAATAVQKSEAIKVIDELAVEVKKARMRANSTDLVGEVKVGDIIKALLLTPFKN